jgi:hypothetical protein
MLFQLFDLILDLIVSLQLMDRMLCWDLEMALLVMQASNEKMWSGTAIGARACHSISICWFFNLISALLYFEIEMMFIWHLCWWYVLQTYNVVPYFFVTICNCELTFPVILNGFGTVVMI